MIERKNLHLATQYLKQLKVQLIEELPHEGEYALHYINSSITTGILNNTTEIKIDLPTKTFSYYHNESGTVVDLTSPEANKNIYDLVFNYGLEVPDDPFPNIPVEEFLSFQSYADKAGDYMERFRLTLKGNFTFNYLWGHNFDFSVVSYFEDEKQVGVGISPGDSNSTQPYLYINPWPVADDITSIDLPIGKWWTEDWTGIMVGWDELTSLDQVVPTISALYEIATKSLDP